MENMKVERIDDHMWRLLEDYASPVFPELTISKGFIWNGASIPEPCRMILNNADRGVLEASCVHDYLYSNGGRIGGGNKLTRKQVDMIFEHELKYYKISSFIANLAYYSVRVAGGSHWTEYADR